MPRSRWKSQNFLQGKNLRNFEYINDVDGSLPRNAYKMQESQETKQMACKFGI